MLPDGDPPTLERLRTSSKLSLYAPEIYDNSKNLLFLDSFRRPFLKWVIMNCNFYGPDI